MRKSDKIKKYKEVYEQAKKYIPGDEHSSRMKWTEWTNAAEHQHEKHQYTNHSPVKSQSQPERGNNITDLVRLAIKKQKKADTHEREDQ